MSALNDQHSCVAFTATPLTAAYTGNRNIIVSAEFSKFVAYIDYARGATEASSKMFMQLEASHDGVTWFSLVIDTTSTTSVITAREWEIGTTNKLNVIVDIAYPFMRLSLKETGVVTNAGTATVAYTLSVL